MYAVIEDSGTQFKVAEGTRVDVDLRDVEPGGAIEFDKVLFCSKDDSTQVGTPYVDNVVVRGQVETEIKDKKVVSFKMRRRKASRRKKGHRQRYLRVLITDIVSS